MKKKLLLIAVIMLVGGVAHAGTYTNADFNFTMNYPGGWNMEEMKMPSAGKMVGQAAGRSASSRFGSVPLSTPTGFRSGGDIAAGMADAAIGTAQDTAVAGAGAAVMQGMMKDMPKFASVTFTNSGDPEAQIMLSIVKGSAAAAGGAGGGGGKGGKGEGGSGGCIAIPTSVKSWAGRGYVTAIKCPQGSQWSYTAIASASGGGANYALSGTMMMDSEDDAKFRSALLSGFESMVSGTSFK